MQPFVRVLVPLGRSKVYTGLIVCGRDEAPSAGGKDVEVKDVIDIVDDVPSLLPRTRALAQLLLVLCKNI